MLLAGDIGGTKTTLAIFSPTQGLRTPLVEATFPSAQFPSLEELVHAFLARAQLSVTVASFGVAGPVMEGHAHITNLPWVIDESTLRETLGLESARLLNDLAAIANAVPHLDSTDLHTLYAGVPVAGGTLAVIAPGTGLGEGFLIWDGARYQPHASEGGHTDFAPTNARELDLLRYLMERLGHVSYERVCSGIGLPNIYTYLKESGYAEEPEWLAEQLAPAHDRTPVIVNAALEGRAGSALCTATLEMFVSILGAEAGNLALKVLATGGVYLAGGIPPRILSALKHGRFLDAFQHKGRFAAVLGNVPVHVILNPKVALLGAAYYGLEAFPD